MIAAENGKTAMEKVTVLNGIIGGLNNRISNLQGMVAEYQSKDSVYSKVIHGYVLEVGNLEAQKQTLTNWVQSLERQVKKEKRKRFWTTIAGVVGIGLTAYLSAQ